MVDGHSSVTGDVDFLDFRISMKNFYIQTTFALPLRTLWLNIRHELHEFSRIFFLLFFSGVSFRDN